VSTSTYVLPELEPHGEIVTVGSTPAERGAHIVAEAQQRAVEIEAEARAAGEAAGYQAGLARAAEELAEPRAAFAAAIAGVSELRDEVAAATERHAVELALAIAERIVGAAIEVDPTVVCEVVQGALRRVVERDRLVVDVNPDDVEIVREWIGQSEVGSAAVEIRAERRVGRGGAVVRTVEGEIDARIPEQLDRARGVLRDALAVAAEQ
jgi:flagellar assembly protein FliH